MPLPVSVPSGQTEPARWYGKKEACQARRPSASSTSWRQRGKRSGHTRQKQGLQESLGGPCAEVLKGAATSNHGLDLSRWTRLRIWVGNPFQSAWFQGTYLSASDFKKLRNLSFRYCATARLASTKSSQDFFTWLIRLRLAVEGCHPARAAVMVAWLWLPGTQNDSKLPANLTTDPRLRCTRSA